MQREGDKTASVTADELASMLRELVALAPAWHTSSCVCPHCRGRAMLRRYRGDVMSPVSVRWEEPK